MIGCINQNAIQKTKERMSQRNGGSGTIEPARDIVDDADNVDATIPVDTSDATESLDQLAVATQKKPLKVRVSSKELPSEDSLDVYAKERHWW